MATPQYPNRHLAAGGRRLSVIELALAVSVIAGLGFVTLRVSSMPPPKQAAPAPTMEAKTELPSIPADTTRTP